MEQMNIEIDVVERIKQSILTAWQEGHGGSATQVHLFGGQEGLVLMIPKALYQAELDLHSNKAGGGKVLNQYLRTLLQTVAEDFIPMVEETTNQQIGEIVPLFDLRAGWAIIFYRYQ
ncbi:MAG: hypothetical protein P8046_13625 [Anaerolineales bacterium]|jgi:hypothetical protein